MQYAPQELIEELMDYAEWAESNLWEVPIDLPDILREAAIEIATHYN